MAELEDLKKRSLRGSVTPFNLALVYLGLGDRARALDYLEKAYAADSQWLGWLKNDRTFDPLRSEPRFVALLKKLRFEKKKSPLVAARRPAFRPPARRAGAPPPVRAGGGMRWRGGPGGEGGGESAPGPKGRGGARRKRGKGPRKGGEGGGKGGGGRGGNGGGREKAPGPGVGGGGGGRGDLVVNDLSPFITPRSAQEGERFFLALSTSASLALLVFRISRMRSAASLLTRRRASRSV